MVASDSEKPKSSHRAAPVTDIQARDKRAGSDVPRLDKGKRNDLSLRPMSLQSPKASPSAHMSGSSSNLPLIKTSTSDKYIKPSILSKEDEDKLAQTPELPVTSSPVKNRVNRSSSEGNLRSNISNRSLFDNGGLSYRETTPDPLFPLGTANEDKKKKGFNTFKKLVLGGGNAEVNSTDKAERAQEKEKEKQEKAEKAQEKAQEKQEKKRDRLSFRLSQGANPLSKEKEKEKLKSSKPFSREDDDIPKEDSSPSQDKKLKGKSVENIQQSTSPRGSSSKRHAS